MARGKDGLPALEMTKWFDTNYHYLVPEIEETPQAEDFSDFLSTVQRAQSIVGDRAVPIILGPITLLQLSRLHLDWEEAISQLRDRCRNCQLYSTARRSRKRWNSYLSWAVDAFRLATSIAKPETQIHTQTQSHELPGLKNCN